MPDRKKIVSIDSENPDLDIIKEAGNIIRQNGVVIFPAKCLYGVAVNAFNEDALKKVFGLKKRNWANPLLILIKNEHVLTELITSVPETAKKLMTAFWPGSLTIVFNAKNYLPDLLTAGTGKIGIRLPKQAVAKALVDKCDTPITGTSANISGKAGCSDILDLEKDIIHKSNLVLDAGPLKGGIGSTVVDVTLDPVKVLRQGEVSASDIARVLA